MSHPLKLVNAFWTSKEQVCVLLSHDWLEDQTLPPLYFNSVEFSIIGLQRPPLCLFGELTGYFKSEEGITFLCPCESVEGSKKVFVAGSFNNWGAAIGKDEWQLKLKEFDGKQALALTIPFAQCHHPHIGSLFKFVTEDSVWLPVPAKAPNIEIDPNGNRNYRINPNCTGHNAFVFSPKDYDPSIPDQILWIDDHGSHACSVDDSVRLLGLSSEKPLGSIVDKSSTTFRLFAPRAKTARVTFYDNPEGSSGTTLDLNRNSDYTWEAIYPKHLDGYYYHYSLSGNEIGFLKILDPYALGTVGPGGPGIIIDKGLIPKLVGTYNVPAWIDLVVMEAHVRDLISKTSFGLDFQVPMGFNNLRAWLNSDNNYIKELGVNAIELLPINEYECASSLEYQWGYMPTNYFCPSSSYTFEKGGLSQIKEFQKLVSGFHEAGIAVILDVVYNHSGNPNHLLHIDKDYYFELNKDGTLTNWSGCGNDFRADTPMGKRLIIDSLIYLINTFDVDGFRFDLAELLGVGVLKEVELALKAVKPSIILIAEPWSFRGHIAHKLKSTGFASWNDGYRDFIANFALGRSNRDAFTYFVTGSTSYLAAFTAQSVNFASSHDDYCWLDRITENPNHDGSDPSLHDIRRTHLMVAILMMSVGMPMLAEGQDILHSKKGNYNTYLRGDLNALDYTNMVNYSHTHEYFSRWIRFRLSEEGRAIRIKSMPSAGYFKFYSNEGASIIGVLYNADRSLKNVRQLLFVVNPYLKVATLDMGDLDFTHFVQVADHERIDFEGLEGGLTKWVDHSLILPPLGCGLWIGEED